jgi:hypothetical protein
LSALRRRPLHSRAAAPTPFAPLTPPPHALSSTLILIPSS